MSAARRGGVQPVQNVELHCHLNGSVRPETIADLARTSGIALPDPIEDHVRVPRDCADLEQYIAAFDVTIGVLQSPEALYRAAAELVEDWAADSVVHGEARIAPVQHTRGGASLDDIVDAVARGLKDAGAAWGVSTSLILGTMRRDPAAVSERLVDAALAHPGVVGVDVTGPEKGYSLLPHAPAINRARREGLRITVHAGEAGSARDVWDAIDALGAERVGHGLRAVDDASLLARLRTDKITVEVCPTSNLQTRTAGSMATHPIHTLIRHEVPVTISCDNRTISSTTLRDERELLMREAGWTREDWRAAQSVAATAAFLPRPERDALVSRVDSPG